MMYEEDIAKVNEGTLKVGLMRKMLKRSEWQ